MAIAFSAAYAAPALAGSGGASIAAAPQMPLDQEIFSGWTSANKVAAGSGYGEWWSVPLDAGDQLVLDAGFTSSYCGADHWFDVYDPSVTDYTLANSQPIAHLYMEAAPKREFTFTASSSGAHPVLVTGCATSSYELTARVRKHTSVRLQAPTVARLRHRLTISGSVDNLGGAGGQVTVTLRSTHAKTRRQLLAVSPTATFKWRVDLTRPGRYRVSAVYVGDDHHLPSSAKRTLRVL